MSKFIAHRGLSSLYYQNSEEAFLAAARSKFFYGIETDVWLTQDKHWVCCHDASPFENRDIKVANVSYEEAKSLPMNPKKWGNARQRGVSYICSVEKYLQINKDYGKVPFIELKTVPTLEELKSLVELVDSIIGIQNAFFISFHARNLERLKRMNLGIKVQILTTTWVQSKYYLSKGYDVDQNLVGINSKRISQAHAQGREINAWTVRSLTTANRLFLAKADYITTDYDYSRWFKKPGRGSTARLRNNEVNQAIKLFKQGYNCSQSVVLAFSETLRFNKRRAASISMPFAHGITENGSEVCGALAGMLMVIGLSHPNYTKEAMNELTKKAISQFQRETGHLRCHEFVFEEGVDISDKIARRKEEVCEKIVEIAAKIAKKLI